MSTTTTLRLGRFEPLTIFVVQLLSLVSVEIGSSNLLASFHGGVVVVLTLVI